MGRVGWTVVGISVALAGVVAALSWDVTRRNQIKADEAAKSQAAVDEYHAGVRAELWELRAKSAALKRTLRDLQAKYRPQDAADQKRNLWDEHDRHTRHDDYYKTHQELARVVRRHNALREHEDKADFPRLSESLAFDP